MKYRKLGNTGIEVSVIALGCWQFADVQNWGQRSESESISTVHAALDCGINFLDTAEVYGDGRSEEILGKALKGRREDVVIADKPSPDRLSADEISKACDDALKRLQTDWIDLYQVHWPSREVPFEETMEVLLQLVERGKIRAFGVCNFGPRDLSELLACTEGRPVTNQLPYNLLWRAIEFEIVEQNRAEGLGLLCYSPLMQGLLGGRYKSLDEFPTGRARTRHFSGEREHTRHRKEGLEKETSAAIAAIGEVCRRIGQTMPHVSLAWLLAQEGVTSVLAGATSPRQVQDSALAAELSLAPDVLEELASVTDALKQAFGPNPDMWASTSRYR